MARRTHHLVGRAALALLVMNVVWFGTKTLTTTPAPAIHVGWRAGLSAAERESRERRYLLVNPEQLRETWWAYDLLETSPENIRALVTDPAVVDTQELDQLGMRIAYNAGPGKATRWAAQKVPGLRQPAVRQSIQYVLVAGLLLTVLAIRSSSSREPGGSAGTSSADPKDQRGHGRYVPGEE